MKLATCTVSNRKFLAVVVAENEYVLDLMAFADIANASGNKDHLNDMLSFLSAGDVAMQYAIALLSEFLEKNSFDERSYCYKIDDVKCDAPIQYPGKLFCLARNYQEHIEELHEKMEIQDQETPRIFMKPSTNTVIGDGDAIVIPPIARAVDWEGELAVVIGKNAKSVKAENALSHVAGYTIMNDVSERKLKIWDRTSDRPMDKWFDWLNGKWLDTFAPMGPWIVTSDDIPDPQDLEIKTYVNDECKQQNSTSQMLVKIPEIIEYISSIITLSPGDVISTGTIAGVGAATEEYLKNGDQVMITIDHIGCLKNRVIEQK